MVEDVRPSLVQKEIRRRFPVSRAREPPWRSSEGQAAQLKKDSAAAVQELCAGPVPPA